MTFAGIAPQAVTAGLVSGDISTYTFTLSNTGYVAWTNVRLGTPTLSWASVVGETNLGDIAPGGSRSVMLKVSPAADGLYAESALLEVYSDNAATVTVSGSFTVSSSRTGSAIFTVMNADKYPTDTSRYIADAQVKLTNINASTLYYMANTDSNGVADFAGLPTGNYAYTVSSDGFVSVSSTLVVAPGITAQQEITMPTEMVTYTWDVTTTTLNDIYTITLKNTFKTDVPAPVLIIEPTIIILSMEGGQSVDTQITITNKGLISAHDVKMGVHKRLCANIHIT